MADPQRALDTRINPYLEKGPIQWELPPDQPAAPAIPAQAPAQTQAPPTALQPTAPPGLTPGVMPQAGPDDDEKGYQQWLQIENDTYQKNVLDAEGRAPLIGKLNPEEHPEWARLQQAKELFGQITNPKERKVFEPQINRLERKVQVDLQAQERRQRQQRTEELKRIDAPREDVKKRDETASIMAQHVDTYAAELAAEKASGNPKISRQADFDIATSPLTTMAKKKPDGTVDYTPLRNAVTEIATYNRLPNDQIVKYTLAMGSPVGTDENGKPLAGYNEMKGKAAAAYKVLGQDARGNVLVRFPDRTLRVPYDTYQQLSKARVAGYELMKKWDAAQAEANKPGLIERTMKKIIPEKGF